MFRLNKLIKLQSIINNADHIFKQKFQMRTLYSLQSLGIDGYLANRERVKLQFNNTTEAFKEKMKEFTDEKSTNMIFTEDLKNMVHITENNADDINLLEKMLKKFNSQNKEIRFGNFIFGPVVMRLFYYIQDVESALKLFKDPSLSGIFEQLISYQLIMDLLYEKQRYQDILDTFDLIRDRQLQGGMFPKHVVVLVMGACYKLNTPKSYEYGTNLWKNLNDVGHIPMRKATTFLAALALKQNAPHISIEILGTIRQQQYVTVRNLKILSLVKLERAEDTLPILRSVLEVNDAVQISNEQRHSFTKEVIDEVEKAMVNCKNEDAITEFNRLRKFLQEHGHIEESVTLENLLCSEIIQKPLNRENMQRDRNFIAASFRNNNNNNNNNYNGSNNNNNSNNNNYSSNNRNNNRQQYSRNTVRNRPGLQDLY